MERRPDTGPDQIGRPEWTPSADRIRELSVAADRTGVGLDDLYIECFARGSNFDRTDLEAMVLGLTAPNADVWDLVALTINELADDRQVDVRVRYSDES